MPTWDDVSRIATALPEVVEGTDTNGFKWEVRHRYFAWERPLRKRDLGSRVLSPRFRRVT